jgi:hypothetical protein
MQIYRLDGLRIGPTFEQPGVDDPGGSFELQLGSKKRALGSVFGHEVQVVLPPTRRSMEHTVIVSSNGANQCRTCSGFVNTS